MAGKLQPTEGPGSGGQAQGASASANAARGIPASPIAVPEKSPGAAIPSVGKPVPALWPDRDERHAIPAADFHPADRKAIAAMHAEDRKKVYFYLSLLTHSHSAVERGNAVVELEKLLGREMKLYGAAMTDSWRRLTDEVGGLVAHVKEHHGIYRKAEKSCWGEVVELQPTEEPAA
jgi:hypothetical protein